MKINIQGLKCDNPKCDFNVETIKFEEYPKYIEHPCSKCGESLLTQEDFDTTIQIVKMVESASRLNSDIQEEDEKYKMSIRLEGKGIPEIDIKKLMNKK